MSKIKYLGLSMAIFGSLFKLMSWAGASQLLIIGLSLLGSYYLLKVFKKTESKEKQSKCGAQINRPMQCLKSTPGQCLI